MSDCVITLQNYGFSIESLRRISLNTSQLAQIDVDQMMMDTGGANQESPSKYITSSYISYVTYDIEFKPEGAVR